MSVRRSPDRGQELLMGEHPACLACQEREKLPFAGAQVQRGWLQVDAGLAMFKVDFESRQLDAIGDGLTCRAVPQRRPYACKQLPDAERLLHVVLGAAIGRRSSP